MVVKFCTTNKKYNSTAIPEFTRELSCILKEGCSIINPTLRIDRQAINTFEYNYAFISDFHRYYWVRDVRYNGAIIYVDLVIDVLASYKYTIGEKDLYILRASADNDGALVDNLFPTSSDVTIDFDELETFSTQPQSYVVGFIGRGSTKYYAMDFNGFYTMLNYILSDAYADEYLGAFSILSEVSPQIKAMLDPLQYISVVKGFPLNLATGGTTGATMWIGPVECTFTSGLFKQITNPMGGLGLTHTINFKDHPQTDDRGLWVNGSTATDITLYTPFGVASLDGNIMARATLLAGALAIDAYTGEGVYTILASVNNKLNQVCRLSGRIGVDIPISQIISGGVSITSSMAAAAGMAAGVATMNPLVIGSSAIAAAGGMIDGIYNATPKARASGSQGTFAGWQAGIKIEYVWRTVADDFNEDRGRPLCAVRKPKNIPGYVMASDPDVSISGTREEAEMINGFLSAGMFYE